MCTFSSEIFTKIVAESFEKISDMGYRKKVKERMRCMYLPFLFEQGGQWGEKIIKQRVDNIIHNLRTSPRQFYRYLDIAYMNPGKINQILSGKLKLNVNDLFKMAAENQL